MQNVSQGNLERPNSSGLFSHICLIESPWEAFATSHLKFIDERLVQSDLSTEKCLQCCCSSCYCCYSMKMISGCDKPVATVLISLVTAKSVYALQWLLLPLLPGHLQVCFFFFSATVTSHFNHDFISSRLLPPAFLFIMESDWLHNP